MLTKKAQTSTEMLLIISAGLLVIVGIVIVIQDSLVSAQLESNKAGTERIFNHIKNEITSAINSPFAYETTMLIPDTIGNGMNFSITLNPRPMINPKAPADITITIQDIQYVRYYWNLTTTSDICIGHNKITKFAPEESVEVTCIST